MSHHLRIVSKRSALAGKSIDSLAFARDGMRLTGQVPIAELSRLVDVVVDTEGAVEYRVMGEQDRDGKAYLLLDLVGDLNLRCQRCLETVVFPLQVASRFLLVPAGQNWPDDELTDDSFDAIAAEKEMALLPLIEDELLLALPIVPRHDVCEALPSIVEENVPSPFAVLGKLKKGV
jgi:uncharacterized protein